MTGNTVRLTWGAAVLIVMAALVLVGVADAAKPSVSEIIVRLEAGSALADLRAVLPVAEAEVLVADLGIYRLRLHQREGEALAGLRAERVVRYAEPNHRFRIAATPNDADYATRQWSLPVIGAPQAWDIVTGTRPITIAIIDTGIDLNHPDLAGKLVVGTTFVQGTHTPQDDHGHGTHVAGIAAASTDNAIGMAGVSWGARLMPVKVVDRYGEGTYAALINGVYYAAAHGAQVLNISLSAEAPSQALQDAIDYAHALGTLIVASAGNCALGGSGCTQINPVMYPAANRNVISVAASDESDRRASFSTRNSFVDVAAPGVGIYSTHWQSGVSTYFWMSGTSQAAPHVAGLAALIWSARPGLTNADVETILKNTARDVNGATLPGRDVDLGWGRIDAARAVDSTPPVSAVHPLPRAQRAPSFTVAWSGTDESSGLRSFTIQYRADSDPWQNWLVGVTQQQAVFAGVPGRTYYFRSSAVDWAGNIEAYPHGDGDAMIYLSTCGVMGAVFDIRGTPVAGAFVSLLSDGASGHTDQSGKYDLTPASCLAVFSVQAGRDGFGVLPPMAGIPVAPATLQTAGDLFLPPLDNVIPEGHFEGAGLGNAWTMTGAITPTMAAGQGHTGNGAVFLGAPMTATVPGGESGIGVTVTTPITAYQPTLSFLYRILTMDNESHDYLVARINGHIVYRDGHVGPEFGTVRDLGWRHAWVDLSAYAGQSIYVEIAVVQGQAYASYPTGAFVDEVVAGSRAAGPQRSWLPVIIAER